MVVEFAGDAAALLDTDSGDRLRLLLDAPTRRLVSEGRGAIAVAAGRQSTSSSSARSDDVSAGVSDQPATPAQQHDAPPTPQTQDHELFCRRSMTAQQTRRAQSEGGWQDVPTEGPRRRFAFTRSHTRIASTPLHHRSNAGRIKGACDGCDCHSKRCRPTGAGSDGMEKKHGNEARTRARRGR